MKRIIPLLLVVAAWLSAFPSASAYAVDEKNEEVSLVLEFSEREDASVASAIAPGVTIVPYPGSNSGVMIQWNFSNLIMATGATHITIWTTTMDAYFFINVASPIGSAGVYYSILGADVSWY